MTITRPDLIHRYFINSNWKFQYLHELLKLIDNLPLKNLRYLCDSMSIIIVSYIFPLLEHDLLINVRRNSRMLESKDLQLTTQHNKQSLRAGQT